MEEGGGGREHRGGVGASALASAAMSAGIESFTSRLGEDLGEIAKSWVIEKLHGELQVFVSAVCVGGDRREDAQTELDVLPSTSDALERALAEIKELKSMLAAAERRCEESERKREEIERFYRGEALRVNRVYDTMLGGASAVGDTDDAAVRTAAATMAHESGDGGWRSSNGVLDSRTDKDSSVRTAILTSISSSSSTESKSAVSGVVRDGTDNLTHVERRSQSGPAAVRVLRRRPAGGDMNPPVTSQLHSSHTLPFGDSLAPPTPAPPTPTPTTKRTSTSSSSSSSVSGGSPARKSQIVLKTTKARNNRVRIVPMTTTGASPGRPTDKRQGGPPSRRENDDTAIDGHEDGDGDDDTSLPRVLLSEQSAGGNAAVSTDTLGDVDGVDAASHGPARVLVSEQGAAGSAAVDTIGGGGNGDDDGVDDTGAPSAFTPAPPVLRARTSTVSSESLDTSDDVANGSQPSKRLSVDSLLLIEDGTQTQAMWDAPPSPPLASARVTDRHKRRRGAAAAATHFVAPEVFTEGPDDGPSVGAVDDQGNGVVVTAPVEATPYGRTALGVESVPGPPPWLGFSPSGLTSDNATTKTTTTATIIATATMDVAFSEEATSLAADVSSSNANEGSAMEVQAMLRGDQMPQTVGAKRQDKEKDDARSGAALGGGGLLRTDHRRSPPPLRRPLQQQQQQAGVGDGIVDPLRPWKKADPTEPTYAYDRGVIRGKERAKLPATTCPLCLAYFRSAGDSEEEIARKIMDGGRHRCTHRNVKPAPPQRTDYFWALDIPDTDEDTQQEHLRRTTPRLRKRRVDANGNYDPNDGSNSDGDGDGDGVGAADQSLDMTMSTVDPSFDTIKTGWIQPK